MPVEELTGRATFHDRWEGGCGERKRGADSILGGLGLERNTRSPSTYYCGKMSRKTQEGPGLEDVFIHCEKKPSVPFRKFGKKNGKLQNTLSSCSSLGTGRKEKMEGVGGRENRKLITGVPGFLPHRESVVGGKKNTTGKRGFSPQGLERLFGLAKERESRHGKRGGTFLSAHLDKIMGTREGIQGVRLKRRPMIVGLYLSVLSQNPELGE